jgi:hypothetical protein
MPEAKTNTYNFQIAAAEDKLHRDGVSRSAQLFGAEKEEDVSALQQHGDIYDQMKAASDMSQVGLTT